MDSVITSILHEPAATFEVVHMSGLFYPEIQPTFAQDFDKQLKKKWHVFNSTGVPTILNYNKDSENPLITKGWKDLKTLNEFPDNVKVQLSYYPPNIFELKSFKHLNPPNDVPAFHSRSVHPTLTTHFDIILDADNTSSNHIILPSNFATFLSNNNTNFLMVCGDRSFQTTLNVTKDQESNPILSGNDWKQFCKLNHFTIDKTLRFKFHLDDLNNKCNVFML
ncbi:hypothetical protein QL285_068216 [Trifolium repens]|nr:hypothetical protein QL285_068216 [Trifolium repens]